MEIDPEKDRRRFRRWNWASLALAVLSFLALIGVGVVVYLGGTKLDIEIAAAVAFGLLVIGGFVRYVWRRQFERAWRRAGLTPAQVQSKWVTYGGKGG